MNYITPKKANRRGARICLESLSEAVLELNIENDIEIKWSSGKSRKGRWSPREFILIYSCGEIYKDEYGADFKSGDFTHSITITTHATPEKAERHLWHELTHAAQAERFSYLEDFIKSYRNFNRSFGYSLNPYEVEANANAILRPFNLIVGNDHRETDEEKDYFKERLNDSLRLISSEIC
jgi:hypothetical protein